MASGTNLFFPVATGQNKLHFRFKERNNINSLEKKNSYQKFGGAMAPTGPLDSYVA